MRFPTCLALAGLGLALMFSGQAAIRYPQIAVGGGYETVIAISNPTDQRWAGQLSFKAGAHIDFPLPLKANGQSIGAVSSWTVEAGGTASLVITCDAEATGGYLEITTQSGPSEDRLVTAGFFRLRNSSGIPVDLVGTYAPKPVRKAVFPIDRSPSADTGVAILAPEPLSGPVIFTLRDTSGLTTQIVQMSLNGQVALMASEIFDQLPPSFVGSVTVESPEWVHLLVLRVEMSQGMVQLTGTVALPLVKTTSQVDRLPFEPLAVQYSTSLDRIVAIASNPDRLWAYDPETKTAAEVALSAAPAKLSVSPDGHFAAVLHAGSVSYVNLVTRTVEKLIPVTGTLTEVVLAGNGYIYLASHTTLPTSIKPEIISIRIADGEETRLVGPPPYSLDHAFARLHPDAKSFYLTDHEYGHPVIKFDIENGAAVYKYSNDNSANPLTLQAQSFEFAEDGQRMFSTGGEVLRISEVRSQDFLVNGSLPYWLVGFCNSRENGRIATIPRSSPYGENWGVEVWLYDYETLERRIAFSLPLFLPESTIQSRGESLFFNGPGTKLYVVVEAAAAVTGGKHGVAVFNVEDLEN
jgi:hypothetical protein